ncbi:PKD domain-containing protein [Salinivirga cyanobacteriivorans]|nr:PKD domain-containing protein [Salinivirga cyanobacteriivorans]
MKKILIFLIVIMLVNDLFAQVSQTNLELWLSGDSVSIDAFGTIDSIYDLSPNSKHIKQTTENKRSFLETDTSINYHPVISFDGTDDYYSGDTILGIDTSNLSYFIVAKGRNSSGVSQSMFAINSYLDGLWIQRRLHTSEYSVYNNGAKVEPTNNSLPNSGFNYKIFSGIKFSDSVFTISINTNEVASSANEFVTGNFTNGTFEIGRSPGFETWDGNIAELIMYSKALNQQEQEDITEYLRNKYAPSVNLGEDILLNYGFYDTTIRNADKGWFTDYQWNSNPDDTLSTLTISETGTYAVTVTDIFGFESSDTLSVSYPTPHQIGDTIICYGDTLSWNPLLSDEYTYHWSTGATNDSIQITQTGNYSLTITDSLGYKWFSDTILIEIDSFPAIVRLPNDTSLCAGQSIGLEEGASLTAQYTWHPYGSHDSIITIDTAGSYSVICENENHCFAYDTISINVHGIAPTPDFEINQLCHGDTTFFIDMSYPQDSIVSRKWIVDQQDTLETANPFYLFDSTGIHTVKLQIESYGGCTNDTAIQFEILSRAEVSFSYLPVCANTNTQFTADIQTTPGDSLVSQSWYINNELVSGDDTLNHQFNNSGFDTIALSVELDNTCSSAYQEIIKVADSYPLPEPFSLVAPLNARLSAADSLLFTWNLSEGAVKYGLTLAADDAFEDTLFHEILIANSYKAPSINNVDTVFWKVTAYNPCLSTQTSNIRFYVNVNTQFQKHLSLWYNGDSVLNNGNQVQKWYDLSGKNYNAIQNETSAMPYYEDSVINGLPALFFDGSKYMETDFGVDYPQPNTYIMLWSITANAGFLQLPYSGLYPGKTNSTFWRNNSTININGGNYVNNVYPKEIPFYFMITTTVFNEDSTVIYENSIFKKRVDAGTDSVAGLIFGGVPDEDYYLHGYLPEFMFFDTIITDEQRNLVENYLRDKYFPPVNLLYNIYVPYGFADTTINTADKAWFTDFQWSTGADDTLSTLTVSEEGTYAVSVTDIFGFESSDSLQVFYPEFNVWQDRSICLGDTLTWDLEPKGPYEYAWSTGASDSAIAISEAGTYSVTITDTLGNSWSPEPVTVSIDSFPATATLGSDTTLCNGNRLELASGQEVAESFLWHDGSTQPYYLIDGAETVSVEVTNTLGCVARDTIIVDVAGTAPRANYSIDRLCRDISINFTNLSEAYDGATITSYNWNFNETGSSNEVNPDYTFADTGEVAVTLTVETDEGCANDTTRMLDIHELPQPAFNPLQGCENVTLQLQNQSFSVDGNIVNYNWEISGTSFSETSPSYTFSEPGNVPVQLVAVTEHDCPDTLNTTISVRPAPNASFAYDTACTGLQVNFNNLTTTNLGQQYTSQWNFEEAQSTARHPKHTFNATGNYNVNLVVTQLGDGCTDTVQKQISVHALPTAIITDQSGCEGTPHELQHASTWGEGEQPGTTTWLIADTTITGEPAYYTTNETGTQQIKLVARNASGCADTANYEYTTYESPSVAFAPIEDTVYIPVSIEIANLSNPTSWEWKLNDTFFSEAYAPTINLDTAGTYIITLTGTDDNGCYNIARDTTEALVPFIDGTLMECRAIIDQGRLYVSVEMANIGSKNITNPELRLTLSNGQMFAETYSGIIYPGKEETYSFRTQYLLPDNTTLEWIITELIYENDQAQANNSCTYIFGEMPQIFAPYPNPVDNTLFLDFTAVEQGTVKLRLYNLMGEVVMDKAAEANKGLNRLQIPNPSPQGGVHTLEVTINGTRKTFRIVL